jgi:hypothetical protein
MLKPRQERLVVILLHFVSGGEVEVYVCRDSPVRKGVAFGLEMVAVRDDKMGPREQTRPA